MPCVACITQGDIQESGLNLLFQPILLSSKRQEILPCSDWHTISSVRAAGIDARVVEIASGRRDAFKAFYEDVYVSKDVAVDVF